MIEPIVWNDLTAKRYKRLEKENRALKKFIRANMHGDMLFFAERFLKSLKSTKTPG